MKYLILSTLLLAPALCAADASTPPIEIPQMNIEEKGTPDCKDAQQWLLRHWKLGNVTPYAKGYIEYTSTREWRFFPESPGLRKSFAMAEEVGEMGVDNPDIGEIVKARTFSRFGGRRVAALVDADDVVRCVMILPGK